MEGTEVPYPISPWLPYQRRQSNLGRLNLLSFHNDANAEDAQSSDLIEIVRGTPESSFKLSKSRSSPTVCRF
jgi:hypothetical protein